MTGGGRHNPVLMEMLRVSLDCPVEPVEAVGLDGDMLEAQAFAYLAVRVASVVCRPHARARPGSRRWLGAGCLARCEQFKTSQVMLLAVISLGGIASGPKLLISDATE